MRGVTDPNPNGIGSGIVEAGIAFCCEQDEADCTCSADSCTYCGANAVLTVRILPSSVLLACILFGDRERVVPCCSGCGVRFHGREVSHGRCEGVRS